MKIKTVMLKIFMLFVTLLITGVIPALTLTGCGIVRQVGERIRALRQEDREAASGGDVAEADASTGEPDVVILDISEVSDWDYLAVTKDGASMVYNVNEDTGIPTLLCYKPVINLDVGFTFLFKENGLPDTMVYNGYILYFNNFDGYRFDLAIIAPDDTIIDYYGVETDIDWDAAAAIALARSGGGPSGRTAVLDTYPYGAGISAGWNAVAPVMPSGGLPAPGGEPFLPDWGLSGGGSDRSSEDNSSDALWWVGHAITAGTWSRQLLSRLSL